MLWQHIVWEVMNIKCLLALSKQQRQIMLMAGWTGRKKKSKRHQARIVSDGIRGIHGIHSCRHIYVSLTSAQPSLASFKFILVIKLILYVSIFGTAHFVRKHQLFWFNNLCGIHCVVNGFSVLLGSISTRSRNSMDYSPTTLHHSYHHQQNQQQQQQPPKCSHCAPYFERSCRHVCILTQSETLCSLLGSSLRVQNKLLPFVSVNYGYDICMTIRVSIVPCSIRQHNTTVFLE